MADGSPVCRHHEGHACPAAAEAEGVLTALADPDSAVQQGAVILIAAKHLDSFLLRLKENSTLEATVQGILVDPTGIAAHQLLPLV